MKCYMPVALLAVICLSGGACSAEAADASGQQRYQQVRELDPVGYWPADEGSGDTLQDRSVNQNDGTIYSVPWGEGLLHFENNVYQWVEIDHHADYASPTFSMGGWVFSRREYNTKHYGVLIIGQPFTPRPYPRPYKDGVLAWAIWGDRIETDGAMLRFGPPSGDSPGPSLIEVVSGQQGDALGSVEENIELKTGQWQHVIYTYDESGTGKLYLNGKLVHSADDVPYQVSKKPFAIGGGRWGLFSQGGTLSLDGSVRDMVLFDRALKAEEVTRLYKATRPEKAPTPPEPSDENASSNKADLQELVAKVRDQDLDKAARAEAALALAEMGADAADAVPALRSVLRDIVAREGTRVPRIEDLLRNAVMRALLDIAPENERVRGLLGLTLARPLLKTLDWSKSYLDDIQPLVHRGRYMEALEALRAHLKTVPRLPPASAQWGAVHTEESLAALRDHLPLREEYFDAYLSRGFPFSDAHYNAYSILDVHQGTAYIPVVERVPWDEVKREYEQNLEHLASKEPDPNGKWSRVKILEIRPDGSERRVFLEGSWLIFDARDAKLDGWSIAVDRKGYIHLTGGQHNRPKRSQWIPGSWKKLGMDSNSSSQPEVMYWVSEKPGRIDSFEFVGDKGNPRSFGGWMNYMQFAASPDGTLFLFGRGQGWSWALQRYNASKQRWTEIGCSAGDMLDAARRKNPEWHESLGGKAPYYGPGDGLVAAYQPGGYNFNRAWSSLVPAIGGIEFDRTGRMHVQMPIYGVGKDGQMTQGPVYAYSDDMGETFHRADGTRLSLPLTVNPIPGHDANMNHHRTRQWFKLWMSLIQEAGWERSGGFDLYQ